MSQFSRPGRPQKYPMKTMAVGEMATIDGVDATKAGNAGRHYKDMRFEYRTIVKGGVHCCRVRRVA